VPQAPLDRFHTGERAESPSQQQRSPLAAHIHS
jgi:hypothetical protein